MRQRKGAKGNPFYVLNYSFEKNGILRLDPYPLLDEQRTRGPRLELKSIWPAVSGTLSLRVPTVFLYTTSGHDGRLEYTRSDIIRLAEETEEKAYLPLDSEFALNAYLLYPSVDDDRLRTIDQQERKKWNLNGEAYCVIPVQFFHIDVEMPVETRKNAKVLETLEV